MAELRIDSQALVGVLEMSDPTGVVPLGALCVSVVRETGHEGVVEIRLEAELDCFHWYRLDQTPAFGFDRLVSATLRDGRGSGLDPGRTLRLEASLVDGLRATFGPETDAADVLLALTAAGRDEPLRQTTSWRCSALTQILQAGLWGGFGLTPVE